MFVGERFPEPLLAGLLQNVQTAIDERTRRLREFSEKMAASGNPSISTRWPAIAQVLAARSEHRGSERLRESFQEELSRAIASIGKNYIEAIKGLSGEASGQGSAWLQGIVDETVAAGLAALN
jgi:hypothetical protein